MNIADLACCGNCKQYQSPIDYLDKVYKCRIQGRTYTFPETLCDAWEWDKITEDERKVK